MATPSSDSSLIGVSDTLKQAHRRNKFIVAAFGLLAVLVLIGGIAGMRYITPPRQPQPVASAKLASTIITNIAVRSEIPKLAVTLTDQQLLTKYINQWNISAAYAVSTPSAQRELLKNLDVVYTEKPQAANLRVNATNRNEVFSSFTLKPNGQTLQVTIGISPKYRATLTDQQLSHELALLLLRALYNGAADYTRILKSATESAQLFTTIKSQITAKGMGPITATTQKE